MTFPFDLCASTLPTGGLAIDRIDLARFVASLLGGWHVHGQIPRANLA
jgi:hypothetical protein